nr:SemiSWEET transporter [uncultured Ralstonia sp.]
MTLPTHLLTESIGYLAALCTTAAFIPQAWLTWRTKSANGISLGMYSVFVTGVALWLVYGVLASSWPMVAANGVTLVLALFILGMKLRFG